MNLKITEDVLHILAICDKTFERQIALENVFKWLGSLFQFFVLCRTKALLLKEVHRYRKIYQDEQAGRQSKLQTGIDTGRLKDTWMDCQVDI